MMQDSRREPHGALMISALKISISDEGYKNILLLKVFLLEASLVKLFIPTGICFPF